MSKVGRVYDRNMDIIERVHLILEEAGTSITMTLIVLKKSLEALGYRVAFVKKTCQSFEDFTKLIIKQLEPRAELTNTTVDNNEVLQNIICNIQQIGIFIIIDDSYKYSTEVLNDIFSLIKKNQSLHLLLVDKELSQ